VTEHQLMPTPSRRRLIIIGAVIVGVLVFLLGIFLATKDTVRAGTTVAGVDIGGLSESEAVTLVEERIVPKINKKYVINAGEQEFEVRPAAAGITLDAQATVEQGMRRGFNPFTLITDFIGSREIEPVISVDQQVLEDQVAAIAQSADVLPVEPNLKVTPQKITLTEGKDGLQIEQTALAELLVAGATQPREPFSAPSEVTPPRVSQETAVAAEQLAQTAVSSPVTVIAGDISATIEPQVIARALSFSQQGNQLAPELNGEILHRSIASALQEVEVPGRDATFTIKKGKPVVVPSVVGSGVADADLSTAVLGVLGDRNTSRTVTVPMGTREPELTTADAQALGITEKISSFTQQFPYAAYRTTNIGQAAKYVNGTLLMPGETFSMNDTIKERTVANGYTVGTVIGPGGVFEDALGGGVSAATTAVWTAAFFAGMEKTDTRAHSLYISRYQPGLEATVAWGIFDMKFTNTSPTPVFITTKMTNTSMRVTFWGQKQFDEIRADFGERTNIRQPQKIVNRTKKCTPQSGIEGFTITVDRVFIKDGIEVEREPMTTVYRAGPEITCKKPKKDKVEEELAGDLEFDNTVEESTEAVDPSASPSPSAGKKPKKPRN
jgi:vancomycin resistance protein YoaR